MHAFRITLFNVKIFYRFVNDLHNSRQIKKTGYRKIPRNDSAIIVHDSLLPPGERTSW